MTGQSFDADKDAVIAGTRAIRDLAAFAKNLGLVFSAQLADTSWTGNDSYGKQLKPRFIKNRDAVEETMNGVSTGFEAISHGTLTNLGTILNTQGSVIESIDEQGGNSGVHT